MGDEQWYVIKIETQNGTRIGIDMDDLDALVGPLSEDLALCECKKISEKLGIALFNNDSDVLD